MKTERDKHQQVKLGVEMMKERNYTSSLQSAFRHVHIE
jgi:hypothetical protein